MQNSPDHPEDEEPPVLDEFAKDPHASLDSNPFEPVVSAAPEEGPITSKTDLTPAFWATFTVGLAISVVAMIAMFPIGFLGMLAFISGAIRVPMMQSRLAVRNPEKPLPTPVAMLAISSVFMLIASIASLVCFAAICFPVAFLTIDSSMSVRIDIGVWLSFGSGAIAALIAFCVMFYLSLRLPV